MTFLGEPRDRKRRRKKILSKKRTSVDDYTAKITALELENQKLRQEGVKTKVCVQKKQNECNLMKML